MSTSKNSDTPSHLADSGVASHAKRLPNAVWLGNSGRNNLIEGSLTPLTVQCRQKVSISLDQPRLLLDLHTHQSILQRRINVFISHHDFEIIGTGRGRTRWEHQFT